MAWDVIQPGPLWLDTTHLLPHGVVSVATVIVVPDLVDTNTLVRGACKGVTLLY